MIHKFPKIMGILNVTPDSFSDGGAFYSFDDAKRRAIEMLEQGADIIDIGGESTRPGSLGVTEEEELRRVLPVITEIKKAVPEAIISIDTTKFSVAKAAVDAGAEIINDISGFDYGTEMGKLAARNNLTYIVMHILGKPRNMQANPEYNNVVEDIFLALSDKVKIAESLGIKKIIADFGIGFGKTVEHNIELLRNIEGFKQLGVPLLVGLSRKTFIGKILGIDDPAARDVPTALLHTILLNKEIDYIRVHNVELIGQLKRLYELVG